MACSRQWPRLTASPSSRSPPSQHVFAPETQGAFSNNDTLSHNDVLSPEAGHDVQQGGVNLGFGDITFGDKTRNTATDGGVVDDGDNAGDIVSDGAVKQPATTTPSTTATSGRCRVECGRGQRQRGRGHNPETDGDDLIPDNEGPVVKTGDIDTSGGKTSGGGGGPGRQPEERRQRGGGKRRQRRRDHHFSDPDHEHEPR